jgi:uncharacterized protein
VSGDGPAGFVPGRHLIDSYGAGGFRFADMSHRGSILVLPSGVHAWAVRGPQDLTPAAFDRVLAEGPALQFLLVGTGREIVMLRDDTRRMLREAGISVDVMQTGAAARTYNIMAAEHRPVGAALIAVG